MGLILQEPKFKDRQNREFISYFSNVLDEHTLTFIYRAKFSITFTSLQQVNVEDNVLTLSFGNWADFGASIGDDVSGTIGVNVLAATEILNIVGNYMVLDSSSLTPGDFSTGTLNFDINPEAFEFMINLVPSGDPGSEFSMIDENVNKYICQGLDLLTAGGGAIPFVQMGIISGGPILSPTIQRLTDDFGDRIYQLNIPGFINYMYTNAEAFAGDDCVKLWLKSSVIPVFSNPAVKITNIYTTAAGFTGYHDEVFNGLPTAYSIDSVDITVAGDLVSAIDYSQTNNLQITVTGTFAAGSKFGLAFFHDLSINDDHFFDAHFENNTMLAREEAMSTGSNPDIAGNLNSLGAGITIEDINISQTGVQAIITCKVVPNAQFITEIAGKAANNRLGRFDVKVEDSTLTGNYIRPVWLTVFYGQMVKYVPPLGPWTAGYGYTTYDHNDDTVFYVPGDDGLVPDGLITEDDIKVQLQLHVPRPSYQAVSGEFFTGLSLSIVARKFTGEYFKFIPEENFFIPFSDYSIVGDAVDIDYSSPRGFKLPPSGDKNVVTVERYPAEDDADNFGLRINYGMLMDWRYWVPQSNADSDFNNTSDPFFNGKNKDWFHYQNSEWAIKLMFELHTPDGSYNNFVDLTHETYDQWDGTSTIDYYRLDGTPLTKPLENEITRVAFKHILPVGWSWTIGTVWGENTNEPFESAIRWAISTYLSQGGVVQNPLQPVIGEDRGRLTYSTTNAANDTVVIDSYFDPSKTSTQNGTSFTGRVRGLARKGPDELRYGNRLKETVLPVKLPSPVTYERMLKECCEPRKVIADPISEDSAKNDNTSHVMSGDIVEFFLLKGSSPTVFTTTTVPITNANGWFSVTLPWHDIIQSDGVGCYSLMVTTTAAGIEQTFQVEKYELFPATRADGKWHENTIGDCRVMVLYNFHDVKQGLDYTDSNLVDSLRVKGTFGKYQPNTQIDNELDSKYRKQKVVRLNDDEYMLNTSQISGKYMRMLVYMLLHENECWISDYNWRNVEYYRDEAVIVAETPKVGHEDELTRKVPVSCKVKSKLSNSISSYNNRNASKVPNIIQIGGNLTLEGGTVVNSDGSYSHSFTGPTFTLPDTTVNIYEMVGITPVLMDTFTHPTLEPNTDITLDL